MKELGISDSCYIDLLQYKNKHQALNNRLKAFSATDYSRMVDNYIQLNDKLYDLVSRDKMCSIMLEKYAK